MGSLTQMLAGNNAAPIEDVNIAGNLKDGLSAGVQLATAQEDVEAKKMKVADQKMELQTKQATAMLNRTKAALFSNNKDVFKSRMAANKAYANSLNIPYDDEAIAAIFNDPNLKITAQQGLNTLMSGGTLKDPSTVLGTLGNSAEMYNFIEQTQYANGQKKQAHDYDMIKQNDQQASNERIAKTTAATKAAATERKFSDSEQRIHSKNLDAIKTDKIIQQRTTQIQNLQNALSNFEAGGVDSKQGFEELQQSVRSNLGIKGQTTGVERHESYFRSLGMSLADAKQFLTGSISDMENYGPEFVDHVKGLANNEINRAQTQAGQAVDKWVVGRKSFYKDRPELQEDFYNFVGATKEQFKDVPTVYENDKTKALKPNPDEQALNTINPKTGVKFTQAEINEYKKSKGLVAGSK